MRILITGATGMLGYALTPVLESNHRVIPLGSKDCDIRDLSAVRKTWFAHRPELVAHLAAYTDVDGCELNPRKAEECNVTGTRNVAQACAEAGALMLHVSTDYVFDGRQDRQYQEMDQPNPINIYGQTKLLGERYIQLALNRYFIVRTSWLFGPRGKNFVATIRSLARKGPELRVVGDQRGCPTYTRHLAAKLAELVETEAYGIYHVTGAGDCSWYEFAESIVKLSGIDYVRLVSICSEECGRPARRPANSALQNQQLKRLGMGLLPHWKEALAEYLGELMSEEELVNSEERKHGRATPSEFIQCDIT